MAIAATAAHTALNAQAIERHVPEIPAARAAAPVSPPPPAIDDDRPIGPALRGIVVLGLDGPGSVPVEAGIDLESAAPPDPRRLHRLLQRYLGQPLSLALIARVEATVTRHYRRLGRSFVTVATPPQELTDGVLRLRAIEYRAGSIAMTGAGAGEAERLRGGIRLTPGAPVSSRTLSQDLDWLNRFPFRHVEARFRPGAAAGDTDITIDVARSRPWQAYGGIATSDAPSTGRSRIYAGALVGDAVGPGSVASLQATMSAPEADPRYASLAVQVQRPVGPRRQLEWVVDAVRTRRAADVFSSRTSVYEAALAYRFALPPAWRGDARIGVQARWLDSATRFGGARAFGNRLAVYQIDLGYGATVPLAGGQSAVDIALHASPGGIGAANGGDRLFFGRPRPANARYLYATFTASQQRTIRPRIIWDTELIAQITDAPLPPTEQAGLGGSTLVRGYTLDDGAFDRMVALRNAVTLSIGAYPAAAGRLASVYGFADAGVGEDLDVRRTGRAISLGLGLLYPVFGIATLKIEASDAVIAQGLTSAGDFRLWSRLAVTL